MSIYDDAGLLDPPGAGDDGTVAGPRYWDQSIGAWRKYGNKKFTGDVDFHKGVSFLGDIPLLPDEAPTENLQATSFQHVETRITDAKDHADTQASNAQNAAVSYTDIEVTGLRNTVGDVLFAAEGDIGDEPSDVGTVGLYRNLRTFAEARRDEANSYTDGKVDTIRTEDIPQAIDGALDDYSENVIATQNFSSEENNPSQTVVGEITYQRDQAIAHVDTEINNLNLGTISTQNADDVDITGGQIVVAAPATGETARWVRNIFISETEPTNMVEGDVWIVPEE